MMDELIKRQDAIDAMKNLCEECEADYCGECRIDYQNKDAKSVLEALQPAQQWIPCSERLPEEPKPNKELEGKPLDIYLVCKSGNIPFRAFWNGKFFTDGWTTLDVDAWMPLPTRYESEVE